MKYYLAKTDGSIHPKESQGLFGEQLTVDENITIEKVDSSIVVNANVDGQVTTLPKIDSTNLGTRVRLRNIGDDGAFAVSVSPNEDDSIHGTIANAAADSVASGVADKDLVNTKATANKGDYVDLEAGSYDDTGDGAGEWFIVGGVGVWASES